LLGRRADCGIVKEHWAEETAFRTGVTGTPVFQQGLVGVEEEAGGALALQGPWIVADVIGSVSYMPPTLNSHRSQK
jgi:hypothetical protein